MLETGSTGKHPMPEARHRIAERNVSVSIPAATRSISDGWKNWFVFFLTYSDIVVVGLDSVVNYVYVDRLV